MRTGEKTILQLEWLIETSRERLRGCPDDRRSINRHSARTYTDHNGNRWVIDRINDANPPHFQFFGPLPNKVQGLLPELRIGTCESWPIAFGSLVGYLKQAHFPHLITAVKPEDVIRLALAEMYYERRPGVHTYHQCECGRKSARSLMCEQCWFEEIKFMADLAGVTESRLQELNFSAGVRDGTTRQGDF